MKKTIIAIVAILLVLGVGYSAGIGYYAEKFQANTEFGAVDISNLTLEEAQAKVEEEVKATPITLTENGQELGTITLGDLNPEINVNDTLAQTYQSQNPNAWITSYFDSIAYDTGLTNNIEIDDSAVNDVLVNLGINNSDRQPAQDASIEYTEVDGYHVEEAEPGTQFDMEQVKNLMVEGLQNGETTIELNQAYAQPVVASDDPVIQETMTAIDSATNTEINLEIAGDVVTIPKEEIEKWVYFDSNNQIVFDQNLIHEWLDNLNQEYATYDDVREFDSTMRGTVSIDPGTLGWSIDRDTETQNIVADLYAGENVTRMPAIVGSGYNTNAETGGDIGDTYVEIDIDNQTMFVYQDGEEVLSTPIVTGQVGTATVAGAYSIWDKETETDLTGYNPHTDVEYVQPVQYWMPFDDTGQGIHDAGWQANFGGNIYQEDGSLGCINTPPDAMAQVYEVVEVGTPVLVF